MLTTTSKTKPAIVASGPFSVDPTSKTVRAGFAALIAARGRTRLAPTIFSYWSTPRDLSELHARF